MFDEDEKDRGNWIRITLRLPPILHRRLTENAEDTSLNATIINNLSKALSDETDRRAAQTLLESAELEREIAAREMLRIEEKTREAFDDGYRAGRKIEHDEIAEMIKSSVREAIRDALAEKDTGLSGKKG